MICGDRKQWLAGAIPALIVGMALLAASPAAGASWTLVLADSVTVGTEPITVGDLALGEIPAAAAAVVVSGAAAPGDRFRIGRATVLRRLSSAQLAAGLRLEGAVGCEVAVRGWTLDGGKLVDAIREGAKRLLPEAKPGAPDPWLEIDMPEQSVPVAGAWTIAIDRREPFAVGRNLLRVEVVEGERRTRFSVSLRCHVYGETARVATPLVGGDAVSDTQFSWQWTDLCEAPQGLVVGRDGLRAMCAARRLVAGDRLRQTDLRRIPLVHAGQTVELLVRRGGVRVAAHAVARQDGAEGQVITVRNGLTGRLVTARVCGPATVEWMR